MQDLDFAVGFLFFLGPLQRPDLVLGQDQPSLRGLGFQSVDPSGVGGRLAGCGFGGITVGGCSI